MTGNAAVGNDTLRSLRNLAAKLAKQL
jgi:hypothetical protein